ncbi:hypothetical protein SKAU_G00374530 [Synaphobranchus kaupii]|uniref:Uncharacterized protein n=1 Tax=Synaphobranchus kaupii TaxID=118154 RepID=A0A9Q1EGQ5_SYNKA|nr:hypothetical protein SKAU_G00374530 [Synaphobranchus kaupii]
MKQESKLQFSDNLQSSPRGTACAPTHPASGSPSGPRLTRLAGRGASGEGARGDRRDGSTAPLCAGSSGRCRLHERRKRGLRRELRTARETLLSACLLGLRRDKQEVVDAMTNLTSLWCDSHFYLFNAELTLELSVAD